MHNIMQNSKLNAQACIYFLAHINIDRCVELSFFEQGRLDRFLILMILKWSFQPIAF